ncbi:MAG: hypothetical protein QG622_3678 [Actinomycetota bacterium]|nr:hypothetical protein [Actinomycetota bacterium]
MTAGEPDRTYEELRDRVRAAHDAVTALDRDTAAPGDGEASARVTETVDLLVDATDQLLTFEDRLPVLRDLPARAFSVQVVRAATLAAALGGVLLVLGIWREVLVRWWAPAVLLAVVATSGLSTLSVAPAAGKHVRQRYLAAGCGIAGLLVGPVTVLQGWPAGIACAVVQTMCLTSLLDLRRSGAFARSRA